VVSDREVLTLIVAHHALGCRTERAWVRDVHHHLRALFPRQLSQSEFNRRARAHQREQHPEEWDALMNPARRLVEPAFAQAKTLVGLEHRGARTL
jgi:hypothetical protein